LLTVHKLLARQLKRTLGIAGEADLQALVADIRAGNLPQPADFAARLEAFLEQVNEAYEQSERDLTLRARSLAMSNLEANEAFERMRLQSHNLERALASLRDTANQMLRSVGQPELPRTGPINDTWDNHRARLDARKPYRDFVLRRWDTDGRVFYISTSPSSR
jgi:hypothetical protein